MRTLHTKSGIFYFGGLGCLGKRERQFTGYQDEIYPLIKAANPRGKQADRARAR